MPSPHNRSNGFITSIGYLISIAFALKNTICSAMHPLSAGQLAKIQKSDVTICIFINLLRIFAIIPAFKVKGRTI